MKQLIFQPVFLPQIFVQLSVSVFGISRQRMTAGSEMGPDLMTSACDQLHLQERKMTAPCQRRILCFDQLRPLLRLRKDPDLVGLFVFFQISLQTAGLSDGSFYQTAVILVHGSVVEQDAQLLQSCHGLSRRHNAAGVAVQAVAHGRMEPLQIFL